MKLTPALDCPGRDSLQHSKAGGTFMITGSAASPVLDTKDIGQIM